MTTQDILELAARCEAATADQQRDLIKEAGRLVWGRASVHYARLCDLVNVGAFLDAAMTLIPEGYTFSLYGDGCAGVAPIGHPDDLPTADCDAATPALALTAASLKARAHTKGEE